MKIRRQRMTIEEYHLLPFHPGWKVEYLRGEAVFQPRGAAAYGTLPVAPRTVPTVDKVTVRALDQSSDGPALVTLFRTAFADSPEYAGWPRTKFREESEQVVANFLSGRRGTVLGASRVAVTNRKTMVGAAFVVAQDGDSALLDVLMVRPRWHRRGVALAMVASAVSALAASGVARLVSTWHLAAGPSAAWHRGFGFVEEPDWMNARLYRRAVEQELWRLEQLGQLSPERREELQEEQERWEREVARLEALLDAGDRAGACAYRRFRPAARPD